jgi:DNA-binding transcriptional LysR family regulator
VTLQQLRYFLAACHHGSFAAAADALYLAQPSLADQVRRLEQELGVRLFIRTGRRLELTEAGSKLQFGAQRVIAELEAAEAAVRETVDLRSGTASLGTFGLAPRYLIREVVAAFVAHYPDVTVRVVGENSYQVIEKVRIGELEAGLVSLPVDESGFVVEPLVSDEILYAATEGPDTEQPMSIQRLAETRLIVYTAASGWRDSIRRPLMEWAQANGLELKASIEVEHLESALELANHGLGGTYIPKAIAATVLARTRLKAVPFEQPLFDTYAFIRRRDHKLSAATAELVSLVRRHLEAAGLPVAKA